MSSFVISKCGHINAAGFSFGITPQSKISLHGNTLLTMAYRLQAETASDRVGGGDGTEGVVRL